MQSYRFSNLLGATYQGGSVQFTPDGNTLLSPVGNRINCVDLVQGRCSTLAPENTHDIRVFALSPDGRLLLSVDTTGRAMLLNFVRGSELARIHFKVAVQSAKWSPDSGWLAITHGRHLQIWRAPSIRLGYQFVTHRTYGGHHDDVVDVSWAPNSLFLATCSKDMTCRILALHAMEGFVPISLAEHRSQVRGVFFSADMQHLYSISHEGIILTLRYDVTEAEKAPADGVGPDPPPDSEAGAAVSPEAAAAMARRPLYCRPGQWSVQGKAFCQREGTHVKVMRCAFDAPTRLFAAGLTNGVFMLFEMPEMQAVQTMSMGSHAIDAVALGANGDWLAVGSAEVGQLLVWEWRSESYVLKQQGHHWGVQCVAFAPAAGSTVRHQKAVAGTEARPEDRGSMTGGRVVATGGYDGKIKLFNSRTGLCFVTFAEHTAPVSALCFTPQGNAVLSASKDGSVRAFDLLRYRNFRTFVSPDGLVQFGGITVDSGGEIVAASTSGGSYAIYVWSIQTGNVLEVLTAHESYVQSLQFSPSVSHPGQLVTAGWDSKLCVWDLYATKGGSAEKLQCPSSVLCTAFDPRANDLCAASCLAGQILFWNVSTGQQVGSVDAIRDIQSARQWKDIFAASHSKGKKGGQGLKKGTTDQVNINQHFHSIAYARSGEVLLCGARNSPDVCLYDTTSFTLAARLTLTKNRSLSGTQMQLNHHQITKDGVQFAALDLSESEPDDRDLAKHKARRRQEEVLPGVTVGEAKSAYSERELHVWGVAFSADAQQLAVASTHGVFVFSADMGLGTPSMAASIYGGEISRFAPQMLTRNVSAPTVLKALEANDLSRAMILALALNDYGLLRKVYQSVPVNTIPVVISSIGSPLLPALIWFISLEMRPATGTPHFHFHVRWVTGIINLHFQTLLELSNGKTTSRTGTVLEAAAATSSSDINSLCLHLLVELSQRYSVMAKTFEGNSYLLRYLGSLPSAKAAEAEEGDGPAPEAPAPATGGGVKAVRKAARHRNRDGAVVGDGATAGEEVLVPVQATGAAPAAGSAGKRPRKKRRATATETGAAAAAEAEAEEEAARAAAEGAMDKSRRTRRRRTADPAEGEQ